MTNPTEAIEVIAEPANPISIPAAVTSPNAALFAKLAGVKKATNENIQVPMTAEQSTTLAKKLRDGNCINIYPNNFNVKVPYRVSIRLTVDGKAVWKQFGYFSRINAAKAVGNIVGLATYAENAMASEVDMDAAMKEPEFQAWLVDARNQEIIARATDPEAIPAPTGDFEEDAPF